MSLFIRQDTLNSPLICFCLNHPFLFLPSSSLSLYKRLFTHAQTRRLSLFNSVPAASNAPAAMPPPLPSNTIIEYRCMHVRSSDAALVLHDSSAELRGEAGNAATTWRAAFIIASPPPPLDASRQYPSPKVWVSKSSRVQMADLWQEMQRGYL